jgi:uncharacterized membrane protein
MTSSSTSAGHRGIPRGWLVAIGLVALSYFCTSLVVVVNALGTATGMVWLPSSRPGIIASVDGFTGRFSGTSRSSRPCARTHR